MINKLKSYFKSRNFINDIFLALFPLIILGIIFYSNNTHLVYWDTTVIDFFIRLFFISYIWIILWNKFGKSFFIYLPLGLTLGLISLVIFTKVPNKVAYIWIFGICFNFLFYKVKQIRPIFYLFFTFLLISQVIQGFYKEAKSASSKKRLCRKL